MQVTFEVFHWMVQHSSNFYPIIRALLFAQPFQVEAVIVDVTKYMRNKNKSALLT
jgi:hypothetical protein